MTSLIVRTTPLCGTSVFMLLLMVFLSFCAESIDCFSNSHATYSSSSSSSLSLQKSSTTTFGLPMPSSSSSSTSETTAAVSTMKDQIEDYVTLTDRGRSIESTEMETIDALLTKLESTNTLKEPTRSSLTGGSWTVGYTTAPPPSNGQLGPFRGIAQQVIDIEGRTYKNVLIVPPNEWLKASLDAVWEEWDGEFIEDDEESISKWTGKKTGIEQEEESDPPTATEEIESPQQGEEIASSTTFLLDRMKGFFTGGGTTNETPMSTEATIIDYGATCWRVTFDQLTISLFGTPIFTKKFDKGTQRIWRTTYLDETTRIVRAGRTGLPDDEIPFYMTRTPPTSTTSTSLSSS
mmetsp:Transcript_14399/g.22487  ORF Transcript_14399/g.22487 Transcript_14399/m.22487 type:complete len:349 (-) Transcript_14399:162-1208(-)